MNNYVEIKNLKEVTGWIGTEMSTTEKNLRKIMAGAALTIMDFAKRVSPVITGRYRSSIHIEFGSGTDTEVFRGKGENRMFKSSKKLKKADTVQSTKFSQQPGEGEIFVGTNVEYAGAVENKHKIMENAATEGQWYLTRKINELTKK